MAAYSNQMEQMADQLQALAGQLQQQAGSPQAAAASAVQQWQQMMGSSQMQQMLGMAQRAQLLGLMRMPGGLMPAGAGVLRPGMAFYVDLGDLPLSASQRASVYRLPPRLREPLIQGMAERGPEGYQRLIDAYYRRIGQEME